jgi:hypothetical protein
MNEPIAKEKVIDVGQEKTDRSTRQNLSDRMSANSTSAAHQWALPKAGVVKLTRLSCQTSPSCPSV